jgi:adenylate cyclase
LEAHSVERKLAAIFAADVAGYSALMGRDEVGTLRTLTAYRVIIDRLITSHRGRIFNTAGDSLVADFASAVDVLQCAVAVQDAIAKENADRPAVEQMWFRIGVHVGDIMVQADNLFGDAVNIAARLEALAEAGAICVSGTVRDHIGTKLPLSFVDLGEQQVKNIAQPIKAYRIRGETTLTATSDVGSSLPIPDKPSIAVLPFQNMSGDPEQEYFADGMVEEITTSISRLSWLYVIARNSSFTYKGRAVDVKQVAKELGVRYVLEGSVRKAGNRVRITGQLIDTNTGAHIWADRFDGALDDIFELQDRVASSVVGAIEPKLRQSEIERATHKPTENLDAYDFYLRALAQFWKWRSEGWREAIGLLRRALALDLSYASAAALFGWCRVLQYTNLLISDEETAEGARFAQQAIEAANDDPDALWMGGWGIFVLGGEHAAGVSAIERALALNPNSSLAWTFCGWARASLNRAAAAIEALQQAIRLSPVDPQRFTIYGGFALAHLVAGRYVEAVEWADRALHENPRMTAVVFFKAAACGYLGRLDEGNKCVERLHEMSPGSTVASAKGRQARAVSPEVLALLAEGWRRVGLPKG